MSVYSERESQPQKDLLISLGEWDPFHPKDVLIGMFKMLCDSHPNVASYESVGRDSGGKDIWLFKIGNPSGGRVMWDGALHGNEDFGSEIIYFLTDWLLNSGDSYASRILQRNYVLFIPSVLSRWDRSNYNTAYCSYGVNLNRNFKTGWRLLSCDSTEAYSGPEPLSEVEARVLSAVWERFLPYYYVNLHQGSTTRSYYSGAQTSKCTQAISLMNSIAAELGITPWTIGTIGSTGFSIGDAAAIYGAGSFLIELDPSWSHNDETWSRLVNEIFPKSKALFIAQCRICEVEAPEPLTLTFIIRKKQ
jgi:hypothetical protein